MMLKRPLTFLCTIVCWAAVAAHAQTTRLFFTGVDANYSLEMERAGKTWTSKDTPSDLFSILRSAGADSFRIRLWTGDDGVNGLHYATEIAQRAHKAGLRPYLVIFLSENWSDYVKQP